MQNKMKRSEIIALYNALSNPEFGKLKGTKFNYAMSKNTRLLKNEVQSIQEAEDKEFGEFENERIELVKECAKKDEKGNPVIENNQYQIENVEDFQTKFEALQEKHEYKAKREAFDKFMAEEVEVDLHTILLDNLPEEITKAQSDSIFDLIEE